MNEGYVETICQQSSLKRKTRGSNIIIQGRPYEREPCVYTQHGGGWADGGGGVILARSARCGPSRTGRSPAQLGWQVDECVFCRWIVSAEHRIHHASIIPAEALMLAWHVAPAALVVPFFLFSSIWIPSSAPSNS